MIRTFKTPVSASSALKQARRYLEQMTREEKLTMIGGSRGFYTNAVERLGLPAVMMADSTTGVNIREIFREHTYTPALTKSTAFPCSIILASTWNRQLSHDYAQAVGEECQAAGIAVLLGPGMNIYRVSQCGRNFEYFGEDPFLAGAMVENYVVGLQNTGTIATLKHFVANNSDYFRRKSNSVLSERALFEIYTPAFKAGIDAGALAVMTSYNLVNGEWCGQSEYVIKDLLRRRLGFDGLVMTDWWSIYDARKTLTSGQDLEMPDSKVALKDAGDLIAAEPELEADLDRMVLSILKTLISMNAFQRKPNLSLLSRFPAHEQIALQTAQEGTVLLRNHNKVLPLAADSQNILLLGDYTEKIAAGGGAATVKGYNQVTLATALHQIYGGHLTTKVEATDQEIAAATTVILSIGTFDSEGWDRPYDLPPAQEAAILRIAALNPRVIAVVNAGSGVNMTRWHNKVAAILFAWYGGQCGSIAVANIISGTVNPSGKLPISLERDFRDSPGYGYVPVGESLYTGWNPEGEDKHAVFDVTYSEEVFVGYRWYEHKQTQVLYPFGFGLSYTDFEYSRLTVKAGKSVTVSCHVHNKGAATGAEIVQVYVQDLESSIPRPLKELKGFQRVNIKAGKSARVQIELPHQAFMFWDPSSQDWRLEPGRFRILVGASSADIRLEAEISL